MIIIPYIEVVIVEGWVDAMCSYISRVVHVRLLQLNSRQALRNLISTIFVKMKLKNQTKILSLLKQFFKHKNWAHEFI